MISTKTLLLLLVALVASTRAFVPAQPHRGVAMRPPSTSPWSSALHERRWNFNDGQAPWGFKKNAEVWNGRLAQMAFVIVFLQELVQGKGVIEGFQQGDAANIASVAAVAIMVVGLTGFLALQGKDDYVQRELEKKD